MQIALCAPTLQLTSLAHGETAPDDIDMRVFHSKSNFFFHSFQQREGSKQDENPEVDA